MSLLKPFEKTVMPVHEIRRSIEATMSRWRAGDKDVIEALAASSETAARAKLQDMYDKDNKFYEVYINDLYQVAVYDRENPASMIIHLSIKRRDRAPLHDWRHLQEIKNVLVGKSHEAVELYPSEDRRVDSANQYHLWVAKDPKFRFPFGFQTRFVRDADQALPGSVQRKL